MGVDHLSAEQRARFALDPRQPEWCARLGKTILGAH